jgi:hypothetical protein
MILNTLKRQIRKVYTPAVRLQHYETVLKGFKTHLEFVQENEEYLSEMQDDYICTRLRMILREDHNSDFYYLYNSLDRNSGLLHLYPELKLIMPKEVSEHESFGCSWFGAACYSDNLRVRIEKVEQMINKVKQPC